MARVSVKAEMLELSLKSVSINRSRSTSVPRRAWVAEGCLFVLYLRVAVHIVVVLCVITSLHRGRVLEL